MESNTEFISAIIGTAIVAYVYYRIYKCEINK
jgi:hypothetical protein